MYMIGILLQESLPSCYRRLRREIVATGGKLEALNCNFLSQFRDQRQTLLTGVPRCGRSSLFTVDLVGPYDDTVWFTERDFVMASD